MIHADKNEKAERARPLILVAEDAGVQVRLMQLCLERADCEVIAVGDGAQALEQSAALLPDLIILDVDMPGANGFQVLDGLRKADSTRHIPVIMLTAHAKDAPLFEEWAKDADIFMTKPFSPDELLGNVERVLNASLPRLSAPVNRKERKDVLC